MVKKIKESKSNISSREKNVMEIVDNEYTELVMELDKLKESIAYLQDRLFYKSLNDSLVDDEEIEAKTGEMTEYYKSAIELMADVDKKERLTRSGLIISPINTDKKVRG